jgi:hypothetical protein
VNTVPIQIRVQVTPENSWVTPNIHEFSQNIHGFFQTYMGFLKTCSDPNHPMDSKFIFARISNNLYETLSVSVREVVRATGHIVCVGS